MHFLMVIGNRPPTDKLFFTPSTQPTATTPPTPTTATTTKAPTATTTLTVTTMEGTYFGGPFFPATAVLEFKAYSVVDL